MAIRAIPRLPRSSGGALTSASPLRAAKCSRGCGKQGYGSMMFRVRLTRKSTILISTVNFQKVLGTGPHTGIPLSTALNGLLEGIGSFTTFARLGKYSLVLMQKATR